MSATPPMMNELTSVTMIAGSLEIGNDGVDDCADRKAYEGDRKNAARHAERAFHRRRGDHRSKTDERADRQRNAAVQHEQRLRHGDEREREPVLRELGEATDRKDAGK